LQYVLLPFSPQSEPAPNLGVPTANMVSFGGQHLRCPR
jgi:hypothetical protein